MNDFRTIAQALAPHVAGNTYSLLDAADAVCSVIPTLDATKPAPAFVIPDEILYRVARESEAVIVAMREGKRINAIKALRALFTPNSGPCLVSLKAAKEACEGPRWDDEYNLFLNDPWRLDDEPPF